MDDFHFGVVIVLCMGFDAPAPSIDEKLINKGSKTCHGLSTALYSKGVWWKMNIFRELSMHSDDETLTVGRLLVVRNRLRLGESSQTNKLREMAIKVVVLWHLRWVISLCLDFYTH